MKSAARFHAAMHYQAVDHLPDLESNYWAEAFADWPGQEVARLNPGRREFDRCFGAEWFAAAPVNFMLSHPPGAPVIATRDGYEFVVDHSRILGRRGQGSTAAPEHAEWVIQDRAEWGRIFSTLLRAEDPTRIPQDLEARMQDLLDDGEIPILFLGSLFAQPRNWLGCERFCKLIYTEPEFIERVLDDLTGLICSLLSRVLPRVADKIVSVHFWEDVCFSGGPLISPDSFHRLWTPRYRQIAELVHRHGIDIIVVDCEGDIRPLVEAWLEGGVNTLSPLEQACGCDVVELRRRYGHDLRLMGGVDTALLASGGDGLRRELERLAPIAAEGGYLPFCDSRCAPPVTLDAYCNYLRLKREIFGIPTRVEIGRSYSDRVISSTLD